jgi:hypothetical protein
MISRVRAEPRPVKTSPVDVAVKKLQARAKDYVANSAFEGSKKKGIGGVPQDSREARRNISRDFKQIQSGLKTGNDALVRHTVGELGARLGVKLPDLSSHTGWHAVGELGGALGHSIRDTFSHKDLRHVMHVCAARSGPINDPDPSNTRIA